jgi:hypothetical protein
MLGLSVTFDLIYTILPHSFNLYFFQQICRRKKDEKILFYYHNVLEAKLVTATGLALSVKTEFILQ